MDCSHATLGRARGRHGFGRRRRRSFAYACKGTCARTLGHLMSSLRAFLPSDVISDERAIRICVGSLLPHGPTLAHRLCVAACPAPKAKAIDRSVYGTRRLFLLAPLDHRSTNV